jgi:DNA-binding transcriptional MocR family regulator
MESGISIAPGPIFSAQGRYENFVRLNYGHPWSPRMEKSIVTLSRMVSSLM